MVYCIGVFVWIMDGCVVMRLCVCFFCVVEVGCDVWWLVVIVV